MEKIIKTKTLEMKLKKSLNRLLIGDEMYFEAIENGEDAGCEKELIFNESLRLIKNGKIKIDEIHSEEEFNGSMLDIDTIRVTIAGASSEDKVDVYLDGRWYGEKSVKVNHTLGCDTASFIIETPYGYDKFDTGADGYYGQAYKFKEYFGFMVILDLDADLFSFDEIENKMKYLFDCK